MRRQLPALAGVVVLGALATRLGADAFLDGLRAVDVASVLAALLLGLVTTVLAAWRWCLVARGLGVPLPVSRAVGDTYRAQFLNSVLPAGVLGDVHRAVRHGRDGARAVVLERVAGQLVVIGTGVAILFASGLSTFAPSPGPVLATVGGVLVVAALLWRVPRVRTAVARDVRRGVLTRRTGPGVVLLSIAALAGHLALFVVAARAAGAQAPLVELVPLLVAALLAMVLPVNVGGWGPREAVAAIGFGAAGFGAALGLTVAVVYGVLCLIACLPGAAVLLLHRRRESTIPTRRVRDSGTLVPAPRISSENGPAVVPC